jgi:hypothetical protein
MSPWERNITNALGRLQIRDKSRFSYGLRAFGPAPGVPQGTYRSPQDGIQPHETSNGAPRPIGPSEMNIWGYRGGAHSSIYHNHGISRSDEFGSATNPLFKPWYLQTGARQTGTHQQLNPYHIARLDNGWDLGGPLPHQLPGSDYFPPQGQVRGAVSPDTHQPQLGTGKPHP